MRRAVVKIWKNPKRMNAFTYESIMLFFLCLCCALAYVFKWNQTAMNFFLLLLSFSHFYLNSFSIVVVSVIVSFLVVVAIVLIVHYYCSIVRKRLRYMRAISYIWFSTNFKWVFARSWESARNRAQSSAMHKQNFYSIISLLRLINLICENSVARQHAAMKLSLNIVN